MSLVIELWIMVWVFWSIEHEYIEGVAALLSLYGYEDRHHNTRLEICLGSNGNDTACT